MNKKKKRSFTAQGWHDSPIAGKVHYQSGYEHKFMIWLDQKEINWQKCREKFPYLKDDGKKHNYIPDFYLPDFDLYLETKGMIRKNDPAKFEAFPENKKLCLLQAVDLKKLGIDVFDPGEMKVEDRDMTKWPFTLINKLGDFAEIGELTEELKRKVSSNKFFEKL